MSLARKLRRQQPKAHTVQIDVDDGRPVSEEEREFARLVVQWRDHDDELVDRAARALRAALARGSEPETAVLVAHVATCNSGGRDGLCTHSEAQIAAILPANEDALGWVRWLKHAVLALATLLALFWPGAATAHENRVKAGPETRIRYRRGNRQKLARFRRKAYHFRSWTRRKRSFGTSRQRSSCRWGFGTGCGHGHEKNDSRGLTSRSSLFGAGGASASATSREMTRISRWNCQTARSNGRPSLRHRAL